jgi:capsular exopolysaccharide synthesis family protein
MSLNEPQDVSLNDLLKVIYQRKGWILFVLILVLTVSACVTAFGLKKWYTSTATIRVEKPEGDVALFESTGMGVYDPYFIKEQIDILNGDGILMPVVESLNLKTVLAKMLAAASPLTDAEILPLLRDSILDIQSRPGTSVIDVSVMTLDPELSAKIANVLVQTYESTRIEFATRNQTEGVRRLKEELISQEKLVSACRDSVEKLRQELKISGADINDQLSQGELENLRQLERTLTSLNLDAIARKSRWEQIKNVPLQNRIALINSELISDTNIQDLSQAYMLAQQRLERLQERLGEAHPDLIAAKGGVETIHRQLLQQLEGFEKSLEISYKESQARVEAMELDLKKARKDQIESASSRMRTFEEAVEKLKDEENVQRAIRITLRQKEIDYQVPKRSIEILSKAIPDPIPSKPSWLINMGVALIAGCVIAFGSAYLLEFMDTSYRGIRELEAAIGLPVLGVIPDHKILLDNTNLHHFESEPFRVIHTNLQLMEAASSARVLVLQSAGPGEGKSTTLQNFARLLALQGEKVIVVDSDVRRPTQHHLIPTLSRKMELGLGEYLMQKASVQDVIGKTAIANLDFIHSGKAPMGSLSLRELPRLRELISALRGQYGWVFLDSPPIIGISDASILAREADGVMLVIQHRRNPSTMTRRAKALIEQVGGKLLGIILNQVPESGDEDYNYYTSNYHYYKSSDREAVSSTTAAKSSEEKEHIHLRGG